MPQLTRDNWDSVIVCGYIDEASGERSMKMYCNFFGKEVEYYRFPAESHELSRSGSPRHRIQRAELVIEFFTRRLI